MDPVEGHPPKGGLNGQLRRLFHRPVYLRPHPETPLFPNSMNPATPVKQRAEEPPHRAHHTAHRLDVVTDARGGHVSALADHMTHFRRRVIEDALLEATATYWRTRADTFDTVGTPTADATALACRRHADLLVEIGLDADAQALLDEVYTQIAEAS